MRRKLSIWVNFGMAAVVLFAWATMIFHLDESGRLSATGLGSLKYFTVLSNLLMAAAALCYAVALLRGRPARWVRLLRYVALVSVLLTFLTVMVFLGPVFGYGGMFRGANLWFHLLVPVVALADFTLLNRDARIPFRMTFLPLIPPAIYGAAYTINILMNGIGEWPNTNDWYAFFSGGTGMAALGALIMGLGLWGLSMLLRLTQRKAEKA